MRETRAGAALATIVASCALGWSAEARAQDAAVEARALSRCLEAPSATLTRVVGLLADAEARVASDDAREAEEARATLVALVARAEEARAQIAACAARRLEVPDAASGDDDAAHARTAESVSGTHGTVRGVALDVPIGARARATRIERVDGAGSASDEALRSAVGPLGPALARCVSTGGAGTSAGTLTLVVEVDDGGRAGAAEVEEVHALDARVRECAARAGRELRVSGQRGEAVYAITVALDGGR